MPKVKRTGSTVIHPNSRKALQIAREEHRNSRLEKRRTELSQKQQAKLKKFKWFRDNIDVKKLAYSSEDIKELLDRYFQRFKEEETKIEEQKSIKGRHVYDRISHQYKISFLPQKEKSDFETSGLEIPNLTKKQSFEYFVNWDGDARFLNVIDTIVISKKSLEDSISRSHKKGNVDNA
ncbi:translation machinery-associated protein 16-like isoform X2 [Stegodyphus dumicola]|uniref:translation machinery-associated protein 16-like isoform X2 n=1 Tax=Stegodyphus dumicola TaxID=202533 RepID=UPI0015AC96BF|nr:translation machinery-associated protein 16-like isoform X2 [Stegodyphus dumicola]